MAMGNRERYREWRLGLFVHYAFFDAARPYAWGLPGVHPDGTGPASLDELATA